MPSKFVKDEWLGLRGMDDKGKFIQEEDSRADAWKNVAKSDRLVRKYARDAFADTRLDDGLHAIVAKDPPLRRRNWPSNRRQWELSPILRCRPWRVTLPCTTRSMTWSCGA